jgi:hypothetical protein
VLGWIAVICSALCLLSGAMLVRHAPAAAIALFLAPLGGVLGFFVSTADAKVKGTPATVALFASAAIVAGGLIGLMIRGRPPARFLWRAVMGTAVLTPLIATALTLSLLKACPLYVTKGSGYCFHTADVLGGWITGVVVLFVFDALVVIALLVIATLQARTSEDGGGSSYIL